MADVENGSSQEPNQTSLVLPQGDNKENTVDTSTPVETEDAVEEDSKPPLPLESQRQKIDLDEVTDSNSPQIKVDSSEITETADRPPSPPNDAADAERPEEHGSPQRDLKANDVTNSGNDQAEAPPGDSGDKQDDGAVPQFELTPGTRLRSDSRSTTATYATQRSVPVSSAVFIVNALETIGASKEAKKSKELDDAVKSALANVKQSDRLPIDPELIFRPLQLATKSLSIPLQVTALDCIGKLITYSYFAFPSSQDRKGSEIEATPEQTPLIERAIDAICDCFENEATPFEIQQQIIKSLLAAVLNDKIVVHGAGLLKAVRQIYNIFIYSKSNQNQQIAQGSLTQMVSTVFDRVRVRLELKELRLREGEKGQENTPDAATAETVEVPLSTDQDQTSDAASVVAPDQPVAKEPGEKLTLQSFESGKDVTSVADNAPTMVTRAKLSQKRTQSLSSTSGEEKEDGDGTTDDDEDEIYIKDAFLVFRALCKLSHKILSHEQQQDLKSQNMRSKLLSLHLLHYLINNHVSVFTSPLLTIRNNSNSSDAMTLLQAVRPHLCLSLSRNGSSSVPRVFEVCCEIFWLMLKHMRVMMKVCLCAYLLSLTGSNSSQKELEVFLKEIYLAILEKRNSPAFQKQYFMELVERLADDPRALVEIYLNYDCDRTALENIFQKYVCITSCSNSFGAVLIVFAASLNKSHDTRAYLSQFLQSNSSIIKNTMSRYQKWAQIGITEGLCLRHSRQRT